VHHLYVILEKVPITSGGHERKPLPWTQAAYPDCERREQWFRRLWQNQSINQTSPRSCSSIWIKTVTNGLKRFSASADYQTMSKLSRVLPAFWGWDLVTSKGQHSSVLVGY
jgi:hypothetical protein